MEAKREKRDQDNKLLIKIRPEDVQLDQHGNVVIRNDAFRAYLEKRDTEAKSMRMMSMNIMDSICGCLCGEC